MNKGLDQADMDKTKTIISSANDPSLLLGIRDLNFFFKLSCLFE